MRHSSDLSRGQPQKGLYRSRERLQICRSRDSVPLGGCRMASNDVPLIDRDHLDVHRWQLSAHENHLHIHSN